MLTISINTLSQHNIKVKSKTSGQSILLRWSPDNYDLWMYSNMYGYIVERTTIIRDGKLLDNPETTRLTQTPVKPLPLEEWRELADADDYASIVAQAIYGKDFEVESNIDKKDISSIVNKSGEQSNRFSFALLGCDLSVETADAAGLYFKDKTVRKGEKYLYRVKSAIPQNIIKVNEGTVYTSLNSDELPSVNNLKIENKEYTVVLSWNLNFYQQIYNSYIIERSQDNGATYERINKNPIIGISNDKLGSNSIFKIDTLPDVTKNFVYRIKGIDSFSAIGPASDTVHARSILKLKVNPYFSVKESDDKEVFLKWEFPDSLNNSIRHFRLFRSVSSQKDYIILENRISKNKRDYTDKTPELNNYYMISAIDTSGFALNSYPVMVQLVDTVPPVAPVNIKGIINKKGKINLTWDKNSEKDIFGYNVFIARNRRDEYSKINNKPIKRNALIYNVNLKSLSDKIYFKINAVDKRQNSSELSEVYVMKVPDIRKPVSPQFRSIIQSGDSLNIKYIPSSSNDVDKHLLYRKISGKPDWELIKVFEDTLRRYSDKIVRNRVKVWYTLIAVDKSGLESPPSKPFSVFYENDVKPSEIGGIKIKVDKSSKLIHINWNKPSGADKVLLYKSTGSEEFVLYRTIAGDRDSFTDKYIYEGQTNSYCLVYELKSGVRSQKSEVVKIKL